MIGASDPVQAWSERPVAVAVSLPSGAALHATLTLPDGEGRVPGVLVIPGSGPTDRDGNSHTGSTVRANDALKLLARALAERGIASLRYDKRGVGASRAAAPPREDDLRFANNVDDAALCLDALAAEPRIGRLLVIGYSEGALVGTLLARQRPLAGLVLLAGSGERIGDTIRRQMCKPPTPPPEIQAQILAEVERILAALEGGETVPDVPKPLDALFRPSVQPYLISWLALDPVAELKAVAAPVLVVQGTTDTQVTVEDARRLASARGAEAGPILIDGMNHVLKLAGSDQESQERAYTDPSLPLAPGLAEAIAGFLRQAVR